MILNNFDLCDCCERRSNFTIETLRTVRPDFIQIDEIQNGEIKLLKTIDVSEVRYDFDYKLIYHDDPFKDYLDRPLHRFEVFEKDGLIYHHYILEGI